MPGRSPQAPGSQIPRAPGALKLAIPCSHAFYAASRKAFHEGPFHRILATQMRLKNLTVISADPAFDALGVRRLW